MSSSQANKNLESRFLLVTGTLVTLLGLPLFVSFLQAPEPQSLANATDSRQPASLVTSSSSPILQPERISKSSVETIELNCSGLEVNKQVDSTRIRVKGKVCSSGKATEISLKNLTSGYEASIIHPDPNQYTSDYIDLVEGENSFELHALNEKGQPEIQQIKIFRRVPASE